MSELHLTRRGLMQMVSAVVITASYAARRPLFDSVADHTEGLDGDVIDNEPSILDDARGRRLETFLRCRGIRPAHLARESGYSRKHLLDIRLGRIEPTRQCIAHVVSACRRLAREPVRASDLFDIPSSDVHEIERMQRRLGD